MRVLISAGGTGGGVYPALAIAREWLEISGAQPQAADHRPSVLWVGSRGGMEETLIPREGLPFRAIRAAGVHGVGWQRLPSNALSLARGFFEALGLVRAYQPNVALVTGSFIAVPVALACWLQRVPVVIYLPDLEPGLAIQVIAWFAARICLTAEAARPQFAAQVRRVVVTGYPVRPELKRATRAEAIGQFGLDPARRTILVTGGSRGARSLNRAAFAALADWLKDYQVIHLSGQLDWHEAEQARAALPAEQHAHYHAFPFLHEMGLALAAADVAVSRAGASALGEYPLFGLPALLVPYPHAWRYQKVNADYLVARGAAMQIGDAELVTRLGPEVRRLLQDEARLSAMHAAAQAAAQPEAARHIARVLIQTASNRP